MRQQLITLGLCLGVVLGSVSRAAAVQPAPIDANSDVAWSRVTENPFDGKIVYDRNYKSDFVFVSSWSKGGIRATYSLLRAELIGYQTTWWNRPFYWGYGRYNRVLEPFAYDEPVYRSYLIGGAPDVIKFALNGQIYTYENGPVSPELAMALAGAPAKNLTIRLEWNDGTTKDVEIGKGTVNAWKEIFR